MSEDETNSTDETIEGTVESFQLIDCRRNGCPQRVEKRTNGLGFPYLFASCRRCAKTATFDRDSEQFQTVCGELPEAENGSDGEENEESEESPPS